MLRLFDRFYHHKQPIWFLGFLTLLVLIPLPFGAARPWASDLLGLWTGVLLALFLGAARHRPALGILDTSWPWRSLVAAAIMFALALVWAFLQTKNWIFCCHALWGDAAAALKMPVHAAISLTPDRFLESALHLLAYAGCFILAFAAGRDTARAGTMLKTLAVAALVYAVYGLLMQATGLHMILWYDKWAYQEFVTSTFVNKNSYATYAGIGLQCCLGLLWRAIKQIPKPPTKGNIEAWIDHMGKGAMFITLMIIVLLGAVIMTGSRGGAVSTCAGCLVLFAGLAINRRFGWKGWLGLLVPILILLVALATIDADPLLDRFNATRLGSDTDIRTTAYEVSWHALIQNPWLGYGLGSFNDVFRIFRTPDIAVWFEHAHNDYLELALELGIPAALLMLMALGLLIGCCLRGVWTRRRHEIFPVLALSATTTVGLHSLVDFGMQIPAIAVTYMALLGLGVAQSWSSAAKKSSLHHEA